MISRYVLKFHLQVSIVKRIKKCEIDENVNVKPILQFKDFSGPDGMQEERGQTTHYTCSKACENM